MATERRDLSRPARVPVVGRVWRGTRSGLNVRVLLVREPAVGGASSWDVIWITIGTDERGECPLDAWEERYAPALLFRDE